MRKRYLFYLTLLAASALLCNKSAAQQLISEKIISASYKAALPGATVVIKGTTNGTTTDIDGKYTITAPADGSLVASFVGYQS